MPKFKCDILSNFQTMWTCQTSQGLRRLLASLAKRQQLHQKLTNRCLLTLFIPVVPLWQMSTSNTTHYVMQMSIDVHIRYLLGSLFFEERRVDGISRQRERQAYCLSCGIQYNTTIVHHDINEICWENTSEWEEDLIIIKCISCMPMSSSF